MRILITGSTGLLGQALHKRLAPLDEVWALSRRATDDAQQIQCDLTDRAAVLRHVGQRRPELIIHAAAQSNVDQCETDRAQAWAANVQATEHLLEATHACSARFIYVSSDYVFDGLKGTPYTETDAPHPVNYYGQTKLAAEAAVQRSGLPWLIVRTSTLFGPGRATFVDTIIQQGEHRQPVPVFMDQTTSPSYTMDVAEGIAQLMERKATGIVHVANAGAVRRDVLARAVVKLWGISAVAFEGVRLRDAPHAAPRPTNSSLAITRLTALASWSPRSWEDALAHYLTWKRSTNYGNAS